MEMHHPLHLLDSFLASLQPLHVSSSSSNEEYDKTLDADVSLTRRQDLVLRVADELLGYDHRSGGGGGTLLENALALLDNKGGVLQSQAVGNDGPPASIRRIRAKRSGREAILFRKQHHGSKTKALSSSLSTVMQDEYYLCIIPKMRNWRGVIGGKGSGGIRSGAHCTCRSFSQNILSGGHGGRRHSRHVQISPSLYPVVTCKHILAAKLMPHLLLHSDSDGSDSNNNFELVDDRLFARLLAGSSIG